MKGNIKDKFSVGPLMYSPALNENLAQTIISGRLGKGYSIALCLEDTISDVLLPKAENQVVETFKELYNFFKKQEGYLPKIFIRIRNPEQMERVLFSIKKYQDILSGFIFPKYSIVNAKAYNDHFISIVKNTNRHLYIMPILESSDLVELYSRTELLYRIKKEIDSVKDYVLNVRLGGNDFSNSFCVRRHIDETIYDIIPLANLLSNIITIFSRDYVVSGPVWEFFDSADNEWEQGLRKEIRKDLLNGLVGKTVIHPNQIPVVLDMMKVSKNDYEDAMTILSWGEGLQVGKSYEGERMNEVKTNWNWAKKIALLAEIYGVK